MYVACGVLDNSTFTISSVKGSTIYHPDPIALCIDLASFDYILLLWCMWLPVPGGRD